MGELGDAEFVIVGGGAIGCAVAYRLAEAGVTDVLLLEEPGAGVGDDGPGGGAGWPGARLGGPGQARHGLGRDLQPAAAAGRRDPQLASGRQPAHRLSDARVEEFGRLCATARSAGLAVELLDHAAAKARWPGLVADRAKAILWCPSDGYLQPYDLAMAYREHARAAGVRFATDVRVTGIVLRAGAVAAVETEQGEVRCAKVINAAGAHAWHVAHLAGLDLPIVPVRHEYFITVPLAGLRPDLPTFRVPDATLYGRPDVGALLLGGWEPAARSCDPREYSLAAEPPEIEPDWPVLANFAEQMAPLYPPVANAGIRHVFRGWPTFTPDGRFIVGESRRVPGW